MARLPITARTYNPYKTQASAQSHCPAARKGAKSSVKAKEITRRLSSWRSFTVVDETI
jgi:hypothetical protein